MTILMNNSADNPARERVQRLFNQNSELENRRRKAAQARVPSDPNAWQQMRENFQAILLEDHAFSEQHEIEYALWQLHYRRIEELRATFNAAVASAGSNSSQNGKGQARGGSDRVTKIRTQFKAFLTEATGFYHDLMLKIRAKYGLPMGYLSGDFEGQIPLSQDGNRSIELKKGLLSCHRCFIYLGDLARYKGLYGDGDSKALDFASASSYYIQATSLWLSSGNPHHQLAILASYSGDELVTIYRYFRSLAVESPFVTAKDNLIIAFEKNRQSYSQLLGSSKPSSTKSVPVRTGRGRGKGDTRLQIKDAQSEGTSAKDRSSKISEVLKSFNIRFVRLNGILFTRTSLETFAEVFSAVRSDFVDLLSSGGDEEYNFGTEASDCRLAVVRLIAILIFSIHQVNKETENQSYAEILQRSVLLENAFSATFELVGLIIERCCSLTDPSASYLLSGVMVFIEWLACNQDIAVGSGLEEKQVSARLYFWSHFISFLNDTISRGLFLGGGDEDETFVNMARYEEGETANHLALPEDFELRGFVPLLPELVESFLRRFTQVFDETRDVVDATAMLAFVTGLAPGNLKQDLTMHNPANLRDMLEQARKFSTIEVMHPQEKNYYKENHSEQGARSNQPRGQSSRRSGEREYKPPQKFDEKDYIPLTAKPSVILNAIGERLWKPPRKNREPTEEELKTNKFCEYHNFPGHSTDECFKLRSIIQKMVKAGKLDQFKTDGGNAQQFYAYERELNVIQEALPSNKIIKSQINSVGERGAERQRTLQADEQPMIFTKSELSWTDNVIQIPLVIKVGIGNIGVNRVLVDTGAAREILYLDCLKKLGYTEAHLKPYLGVLEGFTNHEVRVKGTIELDVRIGDYDPSRVEKVEFLVVDLNSRYHMILGAPSMRRFQMVASIPHQRVKFYTKSGKIGQALCQPRAYLDYMQKSRAESIKATTSKNGEGFARTNDETSILTIEEDSTAQPQSEQNNLTLISAQDPIDFTFAISDSPPFRDSTCEQLATNRAPPLTNERQAKLEENARKRALNALEIPEKFLTPQKLKQRKKEVICDTLQQRDDPDFEAVEKLEEVIINDKYPDQKIKIGSQISPQERAELIAILKENIEAFAWEVTDMRGVDPSVALHRLNVDPRYKPIQQRARHFSPDKEAAVRIEIAKLLDANIIAELQYPSWLANVVMVLKHNGKWRMCVDFTDLNKACPKDPYELPRIEKMVDSIAGFEILNFIDAYSGYHQVRMSQEEMQLTAFRAGGGMYYYKMMPFGLKNAGSTFQRMVNSVFSSQIGRNMEAYIDDMVIKSSKRDVITDLRETFQNVRQNNMKLNPVKCTFGVTAGKFLGFMVTQRGIEANPEKIQAVLDMTPPRTVKETQRLNGRITALGRFIAKSADKCLPFYKVLKGNKNFEWTEECATAFEELKRYLASAPLLVSPKLGDILFLYLAASDRAVAAVLVKEDGPPEKPAQKPVYYVSKALSPVESRYYNAEKLAYSLVIAARKLRAYFSAHTIVVLSDSPLRQVLHKPDLAGRLLKWAIELTEFDIKYEPRKAIKAQALADFLAETSFMDPEVRETISPNTTRLDTPVACNPTRPDHCWQLYVDGASGVGACGAGIVLFEPGTSEEFEKALRFDFTASNNQAEYEAVVAGLELAIAMNVKNIEIFCDSQLVVNQLSGDYKAYNDKLQKYINLAQNLRYQFDYCEFHHIPRAQNMRADYLSRLSDIDAKLDPKVMLEYLDAPSIDRQEVLDIQPTTPCWIDAIKNYIEQGTLPSDRLEARALSRRAARYTILNGILYRRSFSKPLLRCVRPEQTEGILRELHQGICGGHPASRTLSQRAISAGYYWPTLMKDATDFVNKCVPCQKFADIPRLPSVERSIVTTSWPFDMWGIDLIGKLPAGRGGCEYIIVVTDYFTKWIEAKPLKDVKTSAITYFLLDQVWTRFGVPRIIISDHGPQFKAEFDDFCKEHGVIHASSSVSYPQGNGQAENANKQVLRGLKRTLNEKRGKWVDELPAVLWSLRTAKKSTTGETPFSLTYGSEAMTPVEMALPSIRISHFDEASNAQARQLELDLLEESRIRASANLVNHKQAAKQHHDKRVRNHHFKVGDFVLMKSEAAGHKPKKLQKNWEGPVEISREKKKGTYYLKDRHGREYDNTWHADNLKRFYM